MLDDMLDYIENIRERPVWQPIPDSVRARFHAAVPTGPTDLAAVHDEFMRDILPFATGNTHPGFMGWVHGGGNVPGMLAEMLAAGLNANLGGRDHMPIEVERQITHWLRQLFEFPGERERAVRHRHVDGQSARRADRAHPRTGRRRAPQRRRLEPANGWSPIPRPPRTAALRRPWICPASAARRCMSFPPTTCHQIDIDALNAAIAQDRNAGLTPFLVVGTAGTVDTGAIDDLAALAAIARHEKLWFHVDGAIGALAIMAPDIAPRLAGIQQADSIALDFHKWGQVPYDAGFILVRDGTLHRDTFASPAAYLRRETRGLAAGAPWPCDFGPDLSRGFRALKTWFTLKVYGTDALGAMISRTCELARYLEIKIATVARTGAAGAGFAQHRLLPLSRRRSRPAECEDRRGFARIRHRGAVHDHHRQSPRDPRGDRQSPHRAARYRCLAESGVEIRRRCGNKLCRLSQKERR